MEQDVKRRYGLKWNRLPTERSAGHAIGVLMRGNVSVYGWVASRHGEVWSAYTPPIIGPNARVNPLGDGHLVGIYYKVEQAMEAVEAKCGHMIEQAIANRRAQLRSGSSGQSSAGPSS